MIFSNFKPKKSPFLPFLLEKWSKIHKIRDFGYKISSKFENNQISIFFSLVPQIDHPVALCLMCNNLFFSKFTTLLVFSKLSLYVDFLPISHNIFASGNNKTFQ